jgi:site-specific recombinase XerD
MKRFFRNLHTISQKRQGPLGPYIDDFAQLLSEEGYNQQCGRRRLRLIAEFNHWLWGRHLTVRDITATKVEQFLRARARPQPIKPGSAACLKAFFKLLDRKGVVAASLSTIEKAGIDKVLGDFSLYLQQERVLAPGTIANYLSITKQFLTYRFKTEAINLAELTASEVVESVQHLASSISRKRAKVMTSALRAFLRYARYQNLIQSNLAACVPCVADWSVASIPKALPIGHVKRMLACCNRKSAIGRRDYAILLLLARLGLRAGEICSLQLEDIDWGTGSFTVRGKGGSSAQLPLPADVGKAIAAYLKDGRPRALSRSVFLKTCAPLANLSSGSIGQIVNKALARAGISGCTKGAHQFRHALATKMLHKGASLAEIGEILRHRHLRTTSIYAKVDIASLRMLALPWPGGAR